MRNYNYRKNWNDLLTPEIVKKLNGISTVNIIRWR